MRTDSRTYSKEFIKKTMRIILQLNMVKSIFPPRFKGLSLRKGNGNAQEAHEAIRPTDISRETLSASADNGQKRLYNLIWKNTIESCMAPAVYFSLRARITAPDERKYLYTSEEVDFPGWKIVGGYLKRNKNYHHLLTLDDGCVLSYKNIESQLKLKELKSHYTEARLVKMLEEKGIGRPSTFSSLISKIQERGYVQKADVEGQKGVVYGLSIGRR